jgi:hypothetical protein
MTLKKVSMFLVFLLLFFTPLIYSTATSEVFEITKAVFLMILGSALIYLFSIQLALGKINRSGFIRPSTWALGFIAVTTLATAFSQHLYTSLWWYHIRFTDGLLYTLILFGIYVVCINIFGRRDKKVLLGASVVGVIPVSLLAISQHFTLNGGRVYSTIGQANWLAAYLGMLLPLVLFFALKATGYVRAIFSGIFLITYAGLWYTYSLSGLVGLAAGLIVFAIINKQMFLDNKKAIAVLFGACVVFSILNPGIYQQRLDDISSDFKKIQTEDKGELPTKEEPAKLAPIQGPVPEQISDPTFIRLTVWKGTTNLITSSPKIFLIGTGPETFPYAFQKFWPAQLNYSSEWDYIINKPHNYYLEVFSEIGVLGFAMYLGLVVYSVRKKHKLVTPAIVVFHTTNLFGFPVSSTWLLFWFLLSFLEQKSEEKK